MDQDSGFYPPLIPNPLSGFNKALAPFRGATSVRLEKTLGRITITTRDQKEKDPTSIFLSSLNPPVINYLW
jgi:hypothetical protein